MIIMIDYDSFSHCHLRDIIYIIFRFSRGSKRVKRFKKLHQSIVKLVPPPKKIIEQITESIIQFTVKHSLTQ